jgi:hypothetical protein
VSTARDVPAGFERPFRAPDPEKRTDSRGRISMHLRTTAAACALLLIVTTGASADHQVDVNLMGSFPQGEFKQQTNPGIGLSGGYTYGFIKDSTINFRLGGDAGFIIYGSENREEPFSSTIPDVTVDVETTNNIALFGVSAKLCATQGGFQPYFVGKAGLSYFFTETKISNQGRFENEEIASSKNFSDTTTYTALGAGILIPVWTETDANKPPMTVAIDCRFLYWWGGTADYLKKGSIHRDQETASVAYDISRSRTDRTSAHLGVAVNF